MENKILVYYIGILSINPSDVSSFIKKVSKKITPKTFNGEIIIIPTNTYDTRIECINPKYITKKELIKEHESLIKDLNNKLKEQIKIIENEKN